ncbi:hypothetical protein V8E55_003331 [Tylopilus felleus]
MSAHSLVNWHIKFVVSNFGSGFKFIALLTSVILAHSIPHVIHTSHTIIIFIITITIIPVGFLGKLFGAHILFVHRA